MPALGVAFENLLSPTPGSLTLRSSGEPSPLAVAVSLKKSCLLPWLLVLETGEKLPAPSSYCFMPSPGALWALQLLEVSAHGIQQASVFIVGLCERG